MNYDLPLFAYGTLMFPRVISAVIGRAPKGRPATAHGFRRLEVVGQTFPGLVADCSAPGSAVNGILYQSLRDGEWRLLSAFEDEFYELTEIVVTADGEKTPALTYLVPQSARHMLNEVPWNEDFFREKYLESFVSGRQA